MGANSAIAWTHHTFNPWWGCTRVSPGCEHCYAETFAHLLGLDVWGPTAGRRFFADKHWNEPRKWDRAASGAGERKRVFCASMADVFEDLRILDGQRERLWELIAATPRLDWLLLTKRPENMPKLAPKAWRRGWPPNVWAGTTAEDQQRWNARVPLLQDVPAAVRFVSIEPMLSEIRTLGVDWLGIHWAIFGGESGPRARLCEARWIRDGVRQCREGGAVPFVKQLGLRAVMEPSDFQLNGQGGAFGVDWGLVAASDEYGDTDEVRFADAKGGDLEEWPLDLRVREFPKTEARA